MMRHRVHTNLVLYYAYIIVRSILRIYNINIALCTLVSRVGILYVENFLIKPQRYRFFVLKLFVMTAITIQKP